MIHLHVCWLLYLPANLDNFTRDRNGWPLVHWMIRNSMSFGWRLWIFTSYQPSGRKLVWIRGRKFPVWTLGCYQSPGSGRVIVKISTSQKRSRGIQHASFHIYSENLLKSGPKKGSGSLFFRHHVKQQFLLFNIGGVTWIFRVIFDEDIPNSS